MNAIGQIPVDISLLHALNSLGENIIIADKHYTIRWMNAKAAGLLSVVAPLYGLLDAKDMIGQKMDVFHAQPETQRKIMNDLTESHQARITIRDRYVADIIVTAIKNDENEVTGYVVILRDVTTKAEEEERNEKLIQALSVPILKIWKKTIALPLIGEIDTARADRLLTSVLKECATHNIQFALIDLSGLYSFDEGIREHLQKLNDCLNLIGTQCIIVGITPKLAMSIGELNIRIPTFNTAHAGLNYVLNRQQTDS
ncbi:STAS domain-containing protein [Pseudobacillus wudalianchiensis]|uniref:RsbR, positive regulator of sigma-B n=1 Tax=Pseudobacillus wudalianchiensis TaxID=1743143 RepID=A0A1B9B8A8_9BACI|nr:STAS domain-containing protein [Bacillus wudalianchiensis]OCA92335.1 RsbR, positive regulator of sigma-B [Bacillus wudalianchiensis]